jgi:hypothetical protein
MRYVLLAAAQAVLFAIAVEGLFFVFGLISMHRGNPYRLHDPVRLEKAELMPPSSLLRSQDCAKENTEHDLTPVSTTAFVDRRGEDRSRLLTTLKTTRHDLICYQLLSTAKSTITASMHSASTKRVYILTSSPSETQS